MKKTINKNLLCVGAFVKVPLDNRWHSYARVLSEPLIAFYDAKTDTDLSLEEIKARPILFVLWVMNRAVTSGRWPVIGVLPVEEYLQDEPEFFKQDKLNPSRLTIYHKGKERPSTPEVCAKLERAAVWDPEHVEERLRDYFAGRTNRWVESLRVK
jgi:hypothetical protein